MEYSVRPADWYVIQVQTGREVQTCEEIERVCTEGALKDERLQGLLEECFTPRYITQVKLHGAWMDEERLLLPSYVVAVTRDPWELARVLRGVPSLTKILAMGKTFSPLSYSDRSWIERWTKEGDRIIPMSFAYKEGDAIVVEEGPLKGHEAMIAKVNRRKSLAHLEIHAGAMTIRTTVGLAVLPSKKD